MSPGVLKRPGFVVVARRAQHIGEPWHESRTSESIAKATGASLVTMVLFPGAAPDAKDYIGAVDHNVKAVAQALSQRKTER